MKLVIVESPTKAKKLQQFLGDEYIVESSNGHIRDLPDRDHPVPEERKKDKWAKLGVNVDDGFETLYIVGPARKKQVSDLRKQLKKVDELLLATDQDREGEAISWHLMKVLEPEKFDVPTKRMVFGEITKGAILEALQNTRDLNEQLVHAQEARRIIDRLYGYKVSEILWKKIKQGLSAGRVQSVALRMVVEREQARMRFKRVGYWDLKATVTTAAGGSFEVTLKQVDGRKLTTGKDFDPDTGALKNPELLHLRDEDAASLAEALSGKDVRIVSVEETPTKHNPKPPFTTSTMQQEGNRKLGLGAKDTMRAAQRLYENGLITYMRTDSVILSDLAIQMARAEIESRYGAEELPDEPRIYKQAKNSQEAHEAIRPAGERMATVDEVIATNQLTNNERRLYELIWKRTIACQMKPARGRRMTVLLEATTDDGRVATFQATGNVIDFPGFMRAYVEGADDPEAELAMKERLLPPVAQGEVVTADEIVPSEHTTQPPARLTEASLVKELEASGIGRPSTYASIIDKIKDRYVFMKGRALVPEFTAFAVVALMREHLDHLIDYEFTRRMEDRLDAISRGDGEMKPYLHEFYFGNGTEGLKTLLERNEAAIDPARICRIPLSPERNDVVVRVTRRGGTLVVREDPEAVESNWLEVASVPEKQCPEELTIEVAEEMLAAAARADEPIGKHPETGENIYVKSGRFGPYAQLGEQEEDGPKPKRVKLPPELAKEWQATSLEDAVALLSLPRFIGVDAEGVEIHAHTGRYGPYIKRGKDTRSLQAGDDLLTISLERALELLAMEKRGRRSAEPLRVFEKAIDDEDIRLMSGRYGPYVTDGTVNASLPRDADAEAFTVEEAIELILRKRASPGKKRGKKKAKKKATKKKATKKKAAKKKATKKKAAKKKVTKE